MFILEGSKLISSLKHFRKIRENSGFPPMLYESLDMAMAYTSKEDILKIFEALGVRAKTYSSTPPQPDPGKSYEFTERNKFANLIPGYLIEQPGHCEIFGIKVYIYGENGAIIVCASPSADDVSEEHIKNAQTIESCLESLKFRSGYAELKFL
jgi:hypothetical protein